MSRDPTLLAICSPTTLGTSIKNNATTSSHNSRRTTPFQLLSSMIGVNYFTMSNVILSESVTEPHHAAPKNFHFLPLIKSFLQLHWFHFSFPPSSYMHPNFSSRSAHTRINFMGIPWWESLRAIYSTSHRHCPGNA